MTGLKWEISRWEVAMEKAAFTREVVMSGVTTSVSVERVITAGIS